MRSLRSARTRLSVICLSLSLLLAACGKQPQEGESAQPPASEAAITAGSSETAASAQAASLENTHWRLLQVAGQQPVITPADRAEAYFILLSDGRQMQGFGGCNRMGGPYDTDGRSLKFGAVHATKMACTDPRNPEDGFMNALAATTGTRITGNQLDLLDANGAALATFQARTNPPR